MEVLLVRHAHAGVRGTWPGDDLDRPLSDRGRREAAAIADALATSPVARVVSSGALRCRQTVAPYAAAADHEIGHEPLLMEGVDPHETLIWLATRPEVTVACSHGEVIGGVVELLVEAGIVDPADAHWPKASTWVLDVADGIVRSASLRAAPKERDRDSADAVARHASDVGGRS